MITMEQVGARHVDGPSRGAVPARRLPARRPVRRDRRGPARPVALRVRPTAVCPSPVVPVRAGTSRPSGVVRRVTAGIGLAVASAAAVVGLGLLSDAAAASHGPAPAGSPVPVVAQP